MIKKRRAAITLAILLLITLIILSLIFDRHIIHFLSQFKTTQTLLHYSDFWNHRLHDWLGDTITLIGVMLAFTLPFTAQVVQWVVSTYGVNSFPEIIKDRLQISRLLNEMFIFVGIVIFWRVFIYDISPYASSLYILFNLVILAYFVRILLKLFGVIEFILKCTFSFQEFVVGKAYDHIKDTSQSIPTPFSKITDISKIPTLNADYLQNLELLRDYKISKFNRGDIDISEKQTFENYVWYYIQALLSTNDLNQLKQAIILQKKLSTSIVRMCTVFNDKNDTRYELLANSLAYDSVINKYYTLDKRLINDPKYVDNQLNENFDDIIFLAENIESKITNAYHPILSCQYLSNHTYYSSILPIDIDLTFDWRSAFERINQWEDDIIRLIKRLIGISSLYGKSTALEGVYDSLQSDLQYSRTWQFKRPKKSSIAVFNQINKLNNIKNEEDLSESFELLLSDKFNKELGLSLDEKKENLIKLLRIRYKCKVDKLLLFWLKHLSFNTTIIIKILEKASPIDKPIARNGGEHLIPTTIGGVFKLYLSSNNLEFNSFFNNSDSNDYQIVFNTMILYFLAKDLRHKNADDKTEHNQLASNIAKDIYSFSGLTIRNVKSINQIATLGEKQLKGIDSNQGIKDLCIHYGISFDDLKNLYTNILVCLKEQSEDVINQKIRKAPIDEDAIAIFYQGMNKSVQTLLDNHEPKECINNSEGEKSYRFLSIEREWFIKADTGTHYVRKDLPHVFYRNLEYYFKLNADKTMVIFDGNTKPNINFEYKNVGLKLFFYCKYNFYFE